MIPQYERGTDAHKAAGIQTEDMGHEITKRKEVERG